LRQRATMPFTFVLMLGDNIYGHHSAEDLKKKFADPYQDLMGNDVKFYASLGNHDNPAERFYEPFNMGGKRYYSFRKGPAEFFALDSSYMDPTQLDWLKQQLGNSSAAWKICFFHHPLYSDGRYHGPDADLRQRLEPIFRQYSVDVVFSGHEHVYERIKPQNGIYYFVLGNSGELRPHNLKPSPQTEKGFDTDRSFAMFEIAGAQMYFEAVSRTGQVIDSGILPRPQSTPAQAKDAEINK
jgi:3',5'-cyclic AMP phosphodiesterase CpdA